MTLHEENDTRTGADIAASNDGIMKTVDEIVDSVLDKYTDKEIVDLIDNCEEVICSDDQVDKCKCGKEVDANFDICPYSSEIHGSNHKCNCCDACRHECAMDI